MSEISKVEMEKKSELLKKLDSIIYKKYDINDLSICEEYIKCEKCPCFASDVCIHPYAVKENYES